MGTKKKKTAKAKAAKDAGLKSASSISSQTQSLQSQSPQELLDQALAALDACDPSMARRLLAAALVIEPQNVRLLETAGIAEMEAAAALAAVEMDDSTAVDESIAAVTDRAAEFFHKAIMADAVSADGAGGCGVSSAAFLYMGQLADGREAMEFYERGIKALEAEAVGLAVGSAEHNAFARKISSALCSMTEIYMTDCCDYPEAEAQCQAYTQRAISIDPQNPEVHQTHASVLLSQSKPDEARAAIETSLALWTDKEASDVESVWPNYAGRVACAKLLLELGLHERASFVLKTCMQENDCDPEIWYLFGWCFYRMGGGEAGCEDQEVAAGVGKAQGGNVSEEERKELWKDAKDCFDSMLELTSGAEGEEGLEDMITHAHDLLNSIKEFLATQMEDGDDDDDDGGWANDDDDDDDDDDDMKN